MQFNGLVFPFNKEDDRPDWFPLHIWNSGPLSRIHKEDYFKCAQVGIHYEAEARRMNSFELALHIIEQENFFVAYNPRNIAVEQL